MLKEFRAFAMRGSVMDLAIGVIIGGAFGRIIASVVNDLLMPVIGLFMGRVDFANLFVTLGEGSFATLADAKKAGASTLNYGLFVNAVIEFTIIAFVIFMLVKQINRLKKAEPAPATKECPFCKNAVAAAATRCPFCTSQI